ncbi:MAG: YhcH/YjgK/YiaL family protein [Odoribacter sp.]|nr:YhcH/YjgK/YiaL family protein [Odoribacter sp.]
MILCNISEAARYRHSIPGLDAILEFLYDFNSDNFEEGETILTSGIKVKAEAPGLIPRERALLESHRRYIDIHIPLKGVETIGWNPLSDITLIQSKYNEETDVAFYGDIAQCMIEVKPGQMAVFFPEDAHAPNIGIGTHRKLCVKIPVI